METNQTPRLTLVGAGPGDVDLITLKGIKAIEQADYILYDALVNVEVLKYANSTATKVYVGKRANKHTYSQDEINEMIVLFAGNSNHVVRLKGGDPYVFGRGYEELEFAEARGIAVAVVPGITSAISVPALSGIPLTMRGVSESFWVVTGTTKSGQLSRDVKLVAQSSATAVILMGTKKLNEIVQIFTEAGKSSMAVAVIQNGSRPNEKRAVGQVSDIMDKVRKGRLGAPAIIVIGEVVSLREKELVETLQLNKLQVA